MGTSPSGVLTIDQYGWHALACWGTPATPMLNHTGELNAARWWMISHLSSASNVSASWASAK